MHCSLPFYKSSTSLRWLLHSKRIDVFCNLACRWPITNLESSNVYVWAASSGGSLMYVHVHKAHGQTWVWPIGLVNTKRHIRDHPGQCHRFEAKSSQFLASFNSYNSLRLKIWRFSCRRTHYLLRACARGNRVEADKMWWRRHTISRAPYIYYGPT